MLLGEDRRRDLRGNGAIIRAEEKLREQAFGIVFQIFSGADSRLVPEEEGVHSNINQLRRGAAFPRREHKG